MSTAGRQWQKRGERDADGSLVTGRDIKALDWKKKGKLKNKKKREIVFKEEKIGSFFKKIDHYSYCSRSVNFVNFCTLRLIKLITFRLF